MIMKKNSILVKTVLMSMLTAAIYTGFTSCTDDLDDLDTAPQTEEAFTRAPQPTGYNINDHHAKKGGDYYDAFDRKKWWDENSIFLYVGGNAGQDIKGTNNGLLYYTRLGYELQNLPWSKNEGTHSNIPEAIIEDLQNDKDNWQLVLLQCGSDATRNGNYIGFYHKYRGILRILTYLKPGQLNKTDHMWGFSMADALASHSVFGYALPEDKLGTMDKGKTVLNMGGKYSKTITPMMSKSTWDSTDGSLPATEGWWAFDIDLSVYNSKADVLSTDASKALLSLHPLGYENEKFDFGSDMKAIAKGNVNMEHYQASKDGDIAGSIMKGLDVVGKIANFAGKCYKGDVGEAIAGGVDLVKTGSEIAGIGSEGKDYRGDIHLDMSGTITTKGQSGKTVNFDEMPSVDLKLGNFDFAGNTLGQGVWNLETAPVMYCTNAETNWKEERRDDKWETYWDHWRRSTTIFGPIQSPFGGLYEAATANGGKESGKPWHGLVCFFDPSSVKVTLNPHLFSPSEIESAKVTAICGVRQGSGFSRYEQHRTAQGLQSAKRTVSSTYQFHNRYTGEAPFNAFGLGVSQFLTDPVDDNQTGCIGAGDSEYLIEPVGLRGQSDTKWGYYYLPTYEVTVSVAIKLDDGNTLVLSRSYLPEIKDMDAMQVENFYNQLKEGKVEMPAHYKENLYNEQVARIGELNHWIRSTTIATNGTPRGTWVSNKQMEIRTDNSWNAMTNLDNSLCAFFNLLDGDKTTKWASHKENVRGKNIDYSYCKTAAKGLKHTCWFAEFKTYGNMKAKSFTLTSSNTGEDKKPRDIRLFARNDNQGEWVQLFMQDNFKMPVGKNTEMTFEIPYDMQGWYNTYRFEVGANWGNSFLDLNELTMNWAE